MTKLQQVLGVLVALMTLVVGAGKYWSDMKAAAIANDRLHAEVHQLRRIIVSEFPQYTAAIDWSD